MVTSSKLQHWLQHQSPFLSVALGTVLGLGIGVGALFGFEGIVGASLCLLVLGAAFWVAKDAEPVLVGVDISPEPEEASETERVLEPEPEPKFVEPLDMVDIHGGTFLMGSPDSDAEAWDEEKPQHEVHVSDFCISRYTITRQLYRELVEAPPEEWANDTDDQQLPANSVTWFEAAQFCNVLSEQVGLQPCYRFEDEQQVEWDSEADGYRLPTEAEWEYVCRAGTTSKWFCGDDSAELRRFAWFDKNADKQVHAVGQKEPNPWGLHDMSGNAWEWCWDWYGAYQENSDAADMDRWPSSLHIYYAIGSVILRIPGIGKLLFKDPSDSSLDDPVGLIKGEYRVLRGGSAWDGAENLRSASRNWLEPGVSTVSIGFRCVRRPRRQL